MRASVSAICSAFAETVRRFLGQHDLPIVRFATVFAVFNVLLILGVLSAVPRKSRLSLISIPEKIDFGQVKQGDSLSRSVMIHNESNRPIKIVAPQTSCGCMATSIPSGFLQPGSSVPLRIEWHIGEGAGMNQVLLTLEYMNASNTEDALRIPVTALSVPQFVIQPDRLVFSQRLSVPQHASVHIHRHPLWASGSVTDVRVSDPALSTSFQDGTIADDITFDVTYDTSKNNRRVVDRGIRVVTSADEWPMLFVPVDVR